MTGLWVWYIGSLVVAATCQHLIHMIIDDDPSWFVVIFNVAVILTPALNFCYAFGYIFTLIDLKLDSMYYNRIQRKHSGIQ